MNWSVALGVAVLVVVLGGVAAISWWRLASKAAPYRDEGGRKGSGDRDDVVIIRDDKEAKS